MSQNNDDKPHSYTESAYKEFEPLSKEQFNSQQNQNRDNAIVGFLKTGLDKIDELGVNLSNDDKARLLNRRIENLSNPVESSEPQENLTEALATFSRKLRESQKEMPPDIANFVNENFNKLIEPVSAPSESQEEMWHSWEEGAILGKEVDVMLYDGSILKNCIPQTDGDFYYKPFDRFFDIAAVKQWKYSFENLYD